MDIRNSLEGLKSLLGTNATASTPSQSPRSGATTSGGSALSSDRATFSSAGNEVAQTASDTGVRMDKVSSIQAALASGSYNVPSSAIASRVVDSMMGSQA